MTKKQHKVMSQPPWTQEQWVDSKLEKLIWQASNINGWNKMQYYAVTTPMPPWVASGKENYSMVETVKRTRFSKEIAEELIAVHGAFAHLKALEELESKQSQLNTEGLWRDVLIWLDELTGEKK